ncbi:hypothetical protein J6590_037958 [Homalodisca vitripennis]|nr:hypothetical protein J6590_037958 [Homalodisca vitripennis]
MVCETQLVAISEGQECTYVLGIYRPPGGDLDVALDHVSDILDTVPVWKSPPLPIVNSERRHLNKKNLDHLKEILRDQEWDEIINTENVNTAYKKLSGILTSAMNTACPYKKSRSKQRHNFRSMSDPVANRLQKDFLEALEQEKLRPGVEAKRLTAERKKAYDLRLKFCRRQATADFINNADNKPKAIWDTINSERQKNARNQQLNWKLTERKLRIHSK